MKSHKKTAAFFLALGACIFVALLCQPRKQIPARAFVPAEVADAGREQQSMRRESSPFATEASDSSTIPTLVEQAKTILLAWDAEDSEELRAERMAQLEALLQGADLFRVIQELPPNLADYVFTLPLARQQMLANPQAAAEWMSGHTNIGNAHVQTLVHDWARQDTDSLTQYLATLPESEWKQTMLAAAGSDALASDPLKAITWARLMAPGEERLSLLEMATTDWARRDPSAAESWLEQIGDRSLQEKLAGALATGYAVDHPFQAGTWAVQSLPPGQELDRSVTDIVESWAKKEPAAAGDWVSQFPAGPTRQAALKKLLSVWVDRDSHGAETWIGQLPSGSLRSEALDSLTAISIEMSPEN